MADPVSAASIVVVVGDDVRLIMPGLRCCVPGFCRLTRPGFVVCVPVFRVRGVCFSGFVGVSVVFSRVCDTPVEWCVSNGFRDGRDGRVCMFAPCGVGFSFAAAQRVVLVFRFREVGEWWWFENSRAYLYYFFIVNDCQSIVGSSFGEWPGGLEGRWGFRAMRLSL